MASALNGRPPRLMAERTSLSNTHVRIAAIGDIHVSRHSQGAFQPLFTHISSNADVLVLSRGLEVVHVFARGRQVVRQGRPMAEGGAGHE